MLCLIRRRCASNDGLSLPKLATDGSQKLMENVMAKPIEATPAFTRKEARVMVENFHKFSKEPRPMQQIDTSAIKARIMQKASEHGKKLF